MNTSSLTTNSNWLKLATTRLKAVGINSARLDSLLILEFVLNKPRIELIADQNIQLTNTQTKKLNELLERRLNDEPMAYIRGFSEFYGRDFIVDTKVLIPRPESEAFIDIVKSLDIGNRTVADIGTGSGCIGITLKLELPELCVDLFDISESALSIANLNSHKYKLKLNIKTSDLLQKVENKYSVFTANLPYVYDNLKNNNLSFEPSIALFAGEDGMEIYRSFWEQVKYLKDKPEYIITESLKTQHETMNILSDNAGYIRKEYKDLVQLFKLA